MTARDPRRVEDVGEVEAVERQEQVFPGRRASRIGPRLRWMRGRRRPASMPRGPSMPGRRAIPAGRAPVVGPTRVARAMRGRRGRRRGVTRTATGREDARVRALLSVANRDGISAFARDLLALGVEIFATDGTREHLAADGVEVALGHRPDPRARPRRRPGQDVPSRPSTPASSPAATSRAARGARRARASA